MVLALPTTLLPCFVGTITPSQFSDRLYTRSLASCRVPSLTSAVTHVMSYAEDLDEFVTFFRREARRLHAAAVEQECADSTVCDSKYALVTGVVILSHYFHLDSSW